MSFGTVAVNGEVRRLEDLRLQDFVQCFQFGAGFFETLLVTGGAPMFLERHLARLRASLQAYPVAVRAPPEETLTPASCGVHGPGDTTRCEAPEASTPATSISSLRATFTSAPSV